MQKELPLSTNIFSIEIVEARPLHRVKILHLESYKGQIELVDHIVYFESMTSLLDLDMAMKCCLFFKSFKDLALKWFSHLLVGVITLFIKFKKMFIMQLASIYKPLKSLQDLFHIRHEPGESLRKFITRFQ